MKRFFSNLSLAVLFLLFSACGGHPDSTLQVDDYYFEEHEVPSPASLETYFDSLLNNTEAFIYVLNVDDEQPNPDSLEVWNSIRALDDYQQGKTKVFPLEEVSNALGILMFCQWHYDTHGSRGIMDEEEDGIGSRIFFRNYLEQVARLCPHVDYLTTIHTGDDMAGIFTGHEFSANYQVVDNWLLYRYGAGYRIKYLSYWQDYDKIWELSDSDGNNYLLCYNGETPNDKSFYPFQAQLFIEEDDDYKLVCASEDWLNILEYDYTGKHLNYNPKTMTWTICDMKGETKIPSKGYSRLHLTLDGMKSHFSVVE